MPAVGISPSTIKICTDFSDFRVHFAPKKFQKNSEIDTAYSDMAGGTFFSIFINKRKIFQKIFKIFPKTKKEKHTSFSDAVSTRLACPYFNFYSVCVYFID